MVPFDSIFLLYLILYVCHWLCPSSQVLCVVFNDGLLNGFSLQGIFVIKKNHLHKKIDYTCFSSFHHLLIIISTIFFQFNTCRHIRQKPFFSTSWFIISIRSRHSWITPILWFIMHFPSWVLLFICLLLNISCSSWIMFELSHNIWS